MIFPDPSQSDYIDLAEDLYTRASERARSNAPKLVDSVEAITGIALEPDTLINAARDVQQRLNRSWRAAAATGRDSLIRRVVDLTSKRLGVDATIAENCWVPLAYFPLTEPEHKLIPVVVATVLESMLDSLLVMIGSLTTTNAKEYSALRMSVAKLSGFERRAEFFKNLTRVSLFSAVKAQGMDRFYQSWGIVRTRRDKFVHGHPMALSADTADAALNLARNAVRLFGGLQNTYGVRDLSSIVP